MLCHLDGSIDGEQVSDGENDDDGQEEGRGDNFKKYSNSSFFSLALHVAGLEPLILGLRVECYTTVPLG